MGLGEAGGGGKRWRVGVMGWTGRGNYGHGLDTVWMKVPEAKIVGVSDPDGKGLKAARQRLGGIAGFLDYREMLREVRPELVAVASRHVEAHAEMMEAAMESGVRGIYVEKPFVRDSEQGRRVVSRAREAGVRVAVAHRNRYHPALPKAVEWIRGGGLGEVLEVRGRGKEDGRGGGQDLHVLGSHLFNLVPVFTGPAVACSASVYVGGRLASEMDFHEGEEGIGKIAGDEIAARFEMKGGVPFYFASKRNKGVRSAGFGFQIIGTAGVMDLRMDGEPMIHVRLGNPFQPTAGPEGWQVFSSAGLGQPESFPGIKDYVAGHVGPVRDLMKSVVDGREPLCSAGEGLRVVEMIEAVFASHRRSGARVVVGAERG